MVRKILVVVTSTEKYPELNRATGLWLGEAAHFCHELDHHAGQYAYDLVSPRGGYTPIDPVSLQTAPNEIDWKYYACP